MDEESQENTELLQQNKKLLDKLGKLEYSLKVNKLFDTVFGSDKKNIANKYLDELNKYQKEISEKSQLLKSLTVNNQEYQSQLELLEKKLLSLPQSKLSNNYEERAGMVNNNDSKQLSEFFNSSVVYSITQKENENYKNKILLEKIISICENR